MKKLVVGLAALWLSFALAQDTTSCAPLLEGMQAEAQAQQALWEGIQSVTTQTDITQTIDGQTYAVTTNAVYDLENRRIHQTIATNGQETMVLRYVNGEATMSMSGMDMPAPPQMMEPLEGQLEQLLDGNFGSPASMWGEAEIVSCDGAQQYGDVLSGEQVTVRLSEANSLVQGADAPIRFVFAQGELKGMVQEVPELGTTLTVFEDMTTNSDGLTESMTMRLYSWDGAQAQETGLMTMQNSYNEPIDETLFAP
jgi:hypothetical protein